MLRYVIGKLYIWQRCFANTLRQSVIFVFLYLKDSYLAILSFEIVLSV